MVSTTSIIFMFITLAVSLLLPIVFLVILVRRRKGLLVAWVVGAVGFILPQVLIRLPILQLLGTQKAYLQFSKDHPLLILFLLALTAGLFETAGRLLSLKVILSKKLSYMTGLAAGAGHGGIESIILVGMTYVSNLAVSFLINTGKLSVFFPDNPNISEGIAKLMAETKPEMFLAAGAERIFTMAFHFALSVILTLFIIKKRTALGFALVTGLHFALDFILPLMQFKGLSIWLIELAAFAVALASVLMVIRIRPCFGSRIESHLSAADPLRDPLDGVGQEVGQGRQDDDGRS